MRACVQMCAKQVPAAAAAGAGVPLGECPCACVGGLLVLAVAAAGPEDLIGFPSEATASGAKLCTRVRKCKKKGKKEKNTNVHMAGRHTN